MKKYKAFNIIFQSEIDIPEFLESEEEAQVSIRFGKVEYPLAKPTHTGVRFQAKEDIFVFKMDNVAKYQINKGAEIIIEQCNDVDEKDVRVFLLGTVMGALMHQRGLLPFHGSSVVIGDKCFIISGKSGLGKSTLAANFCKKGYAILADDISVISVKDGNIFVNPAFPKIKLWKDALERFNEDASDFSKTRESLEKYQYPAEKNFSKEKKLLQRIYILKKKNSPVVDLRYVKGVDKFSALQNNTYRFQFLKGLNQTANHFKLLQEISQKIEVVDIYKSDVGLFYDEISSIIEKDMQMF